MVLIDDDERVLRGLKMIIPWQELECQWAGQARDGVEGIQLVKETKPDVIMTDIYMPVKNGLDMIEELQDWGYDGQVIVLSGYNDFEYARKALRLQINDYLSKPASKETIRTVFQQTIARLEEKKQEDQMEREWLESMMTDAMRINWALIREGNLHSSGALTRANVTDRFLTSNQHLQDSIKQADEKTAIKLIRTIYEVVENETYHEQTAIQLGIQIWTIITYSLYEIGIRLDDLSLSDDDIYNRLSHYQSWNESVQLFEGIVVEVCQSQQWDENLKHRQLVEQMLESIQQRMNENITLSDLAEELFISRNYLGQIFRKIVGESFKDYLLRVRMEKAKKMIYEGSYLIYEISEKVGYTNPAYFSSAFKKYSGQTPTELIQKRARIK
ncbi:response regulator transcription factor [Alkalihalobacillus sp. FSL W8-0930]